ncbi:hypothetical protein IQ07DRAFT_510046 [Pyrenochaeta sp. DS3sAY3a]|nr:hypothetical protein IQ07DRAFT_510046 [Pyrenochaeta sp. DS3sAY3a]
MNGMSGMSSTFSSSTRVTLWFTDWTTTSTTTYVLTFFFLFFLGIFNRFLGAFKSQLERKWKTKHTPQATSLQQHIAARKPGESEFRGHARQWSRKLRPEPVRLEDEEEKETQPLSPAPQPNNEDGSSIGRLSASRRAFWVANAPWSIKNDSISAFVEFIRALIGYVLMLAVMTYNIGFLFAVTGSVLLGELVFGRYTRGSARLAEDSCHS